MSGSLQRGLETSPARLVFTMNGFDHEVFDFMGAIQNSEISHEIFLTSMLSKYLKKNEGILSDIFQVSKPPLNLTLNPYWQILENLSGNFSEISLFRGVTKAS